MGAISPNHKIAATTAANKIIVEATAKATTTRTVNRPAANNRLSKTASWLALKPVAVKCSAQPAATASL